LAEQDRRERLRFPIDAELRFHVIRRGQGRLIEGAGQAANMSSKGLAFRTETPLTRGTRLAVSLAWPALLDHRCMLRLAVEGTVVRTDGDLVVVSIATHDFRTSGRTNGPARDEIATLARGMDSLYSARLA
jgi:PilZ domain-containing protein